MFWLNSYRNQQTQNNHITTTDITIVAAATTTITTITTTTATTVLPLLTYVLTPWSRILEKLTGSQLVKEFPAFYGTRMFITAFTSAPHLSLSCPSPVPNKSSPCPPFSEGTY